MAIDNRLQVFNEEGQSVDYDILASDVKFLPDGKDLPTKLAEMEAHQGDGTVKGVKMNNGSPIEPDGDGVVDLGTVITQHQDISGKVDKNGTDSLMSAEEHTKLAGIEAGAEKNIIKGVKASGASTNLPVDQNGVVELPPAGSTISPATAAPLEDGTAGVGSSAKYAREDHVHPHDTSKANASDVYTKAQADTLLAGKQNTLTFDTTPTAGHTTQVMSSDSIKTALDEKANAADVPTKTEMSDAIDDALGEAQVAVVPAGSIGVIDSMGSDSTVDALSANMGKRFKAAILTLLGSIGNYCFPAGKPQLILDGSTSTTFSVTYSQSDLHVTYADGQGGAAPSTVELLGGLEIQLGTNDDLYVINESTVKVFVGGNEVANAYDPTTDKIVIPEVYGNVVIIAQAMTYVQDHLVLHLDCRHRGGTGTEVSGHWKSLVNYNGTPIDFELKGGTTATENGVSFDGDDDYAEANTTLGIPVTGGTIESVHSDVDNQINPIVTNPVDGKIGLSVFRPTAQGNKLTSIIMATSIPDENYCGLVGNVTDFALSINKDRAYNKGVSFVLQYNNYLAIDPTTQTKLVLGARFKSNGNNFFEGTIRSIRVYDTVLTEAQQLQNWKVDKKRFNLS